MLSTLMLLAEKQQLSLSIDKSCILHIGKGIICANFYMNDSPLPLVSLCRDLGITIKNYLSPSSYINDIVRKEHFRANMIRRCFVWPNVRLLVHASYVRPLLEYSCVGLRTYLQRDIQLVEYVQSRFTKTLPGYHNFSYDKLLKLLKMEKLEVFLSWSIFSFLFMVLSYAIWMDILKSIVYHSSQ